MHGLKMNLPGIRILVVLGDFNIAPEDRDVHDPVVWNEDSILTSTSGTRRS